ncbi:acyl-CoA dehydrogenase family protein [Nonomuraea sp. NPDC050691]|uniref:acyl-CoA dehydrogenase family protein n=1 Tax=Nonomuraea sp. NPDC050691 TaxID=3155661 RepID=UPI0033C165FE
MRSLEVARETAERHLPGLCAALSELPLLDLEKPGNPGIALFRAHGGPALLVPEEHGGVGASPVEVMRTITAVASCSPSLAVGTAMHHFTVATLYEVVAANPEALETILLQEIAAKGLLISSGGAEGRTGQSIVAPSMAAVPVDGGYLVNGSKKPCSLARSMDLLSATVALPGGDDGPALGMMVVPADLPGISVHPFWRSEILAGAESEEVRLTDVEVAEDFVVRPDLDDPSGVDALTAIAFVWFQCMISAVYLGAAAALAERVFRERRGGTAGRAALGVRLDTATCLVEGLARLVEGRDFGDDALAKAVISRFAVQDAITDAAAQAAELLGGMAFIRSPEIAYLLAACRPLAFHPPSRTACLEGLADYFEGRPFRIA